MTPQMQEIDQKVRAFIDVMRKQHPGFGFHVMSLEPNAEGFALHQRSNVSETMLRTLFHAALKDLDDGKFLLDEVTDAAP